MLTVSPKYITNTAGKKISVVLPIKDFNAMMEELEELEDIRRYDKAKKSKDKALPVDEAFRRIEAQRKKK